MILKEILANAVMQIIAAAQKKQTTLASSAAVSSPKNSPTGHDSSNTDFVANPLSESEKNHDEIKNYVHLLLSAFEKIFLPEKYQKDIIQEYTLKLKTPILTTAQLKEIKNQYNKEISQDISNTISVGLLYFTRLLEIDPLPAQVTEKRMGQFFFVCCIIANKYINDISATTKNSIFSNTNPNTNEQNIPIITTQEINTVELSLLNIFYLMPQQESSNIFNFSEDEIDGIKAQYFVSKDSNTNQTSFDWQDEDIQNAYKKEKSRVLFRLNILKVLNKCLSIAELSSRLKNFQLIYEIFENHEFSEEAIPEEIFLIVFELLNEKIQILLNTKSNAHPPAPDETSIINEIFMTLENFNTIYQDLKAEQFKCYEFEVKINTNNVVKTVSLKLQSEILESYFSNFYHDIIINFNEYFSKYLILQTPVKQKNIFLKFLSLVHEKLNMEELAKITPNSIKKMAVDFLFGIHMSRKLEEITSLSEMIAFISDQSSILIFMDLFEKHFIEIEYEKLLRKFFFSLEKRISVIAKKIFSGSEFIDIFLDFTKEIIAIKDKVLYIKRGASQKDDPEYFDKILIINYFQTLISEVAIKSLSDYLAQLQDIGARKECTLLIEQKFRDILWPQVIAQIVDLSGSTSTKILSTPLRSQHDSSVSRELFSSASDSSSPDFNTSSVRRILPFNSFLLGKTGDITPPQRFLSASRELFPSGSSSSSSSSSTSSASRILPPSSFTLAATGDTTPPEPHSLSLPPALHNLSQSQNISQFKLTSTLANKK